MGESLAIRLTDFEEVTERIQYMVEQVERITEIEGFGKYITAMLEIDAFFVNEDRHTNNIAVIYNEKHRDIRSALYLTRDFAYLQIPVWTIH